MAQFPARRHVSFLFGLGFLASSLEAQLAPSTPPGEELAAPHDFGGDSQSLILSYTEFLPLSTVGAETNAFTGTGTKWVTQGTGTFSSLSAALNGRIPNGAVITSICAFGRDTDPAAGHDVHVQLLRNHVDVSGGDPGVFVTSAVSSTGSGGDFSTCGPLNIRVDNRYNIDGDASDEYIDYNVFVGFGPNEDVFGGALRIRLVRITWHRQVSPAPAFASFADVPTNHPFHRFVEALYAAGITAGCGGGNYCVNNPITRGEMAVFLAAALGLHWPAF